MNFKEFDYEFDLNGYIVLKNIIDKKKINKINKILKSLEEIQINSSKFWIFFW